MMVSDTSYYLTGYFLLIFSELLWLDSNFYLPETVQVLCNRNLKFHFS